LCRPFRARSFLLDVVPGRCPGLVCCSPFGASPIKGLTFMSQSLVKNLVHLVYSTKHREPMISSGPSGGPVRVSGGNLQAMGKPCAGHSWRGRPRSRAVRIVEKPSVEEAGRGSKEGQFKMDEVGRAMQPAIQLASRLGCVFRQPIQLRGRAEIHRAAGRTSSQD